MTGNRTPAPGGRRRIGRLLAGAAAALTLGGVLGGCAPSGPDAGAEQAAAGYLAELGEWSAELTLAAPRAKTWTQGEIDAADGSGAELADETGLGDVLELAPELEQFDADTVERTPSYRDAAAVAERVGAVLDELRSLEPAAVKQLRAAGAATSLVAFDLYSETYGGPATRRLEAYSAALDAGIISEEGRAIQREADAAFARERIGFLDTAIEAMRGTPEGADEPLIPDAPIGRSVGAFVVDWYEEDRAFEERALAQTEQWTRTPGMYGELWGFEDLSSAFRVAVEHAGELRPRYAEIIATLVDDAEAGRAPTAAAGDAYRALLIDGYLPWGDAAEGPNHAIDRLWMLWRIRELDGTSEEAYAAARAALLEELNRGIPEGTVRDHRPGGTRALVAVGAIVDQTEASPDDADADWEPMLGRIAELLAFAAHLREEPMMAEVAADYDAMVAELEAARDELAALREHPDPDAGELAADFEVSVAFIRLNGELQERLVPLLSPSLSLLDDDARFSARLAELIEATAPEASAASDS
ncbi:hypothetical protein ACFOE1_10540 [Agromyces mediolanus]|uniref:DUF885 domain-containing protein n=1 Tax=Agromyces mediolanus TaxID=41986 RepID=A0A918F636_AGRME|nr:hypothetical protein [Agromyces mediolanus]GGR12091.1 hypothetical protein GCM10010196_00610 [Agromyces mediolanus]GLJ73314.1 hypothetical protein GCM10017583_25720 [Agromyces mediolanus]